MENPWSKPPGTRAWQRQWLVLTVLHAGCPVVGSSTTDKYQDPPGTSTPSDTGDTASEGTGTGDTGDSGTSTSDTADTGTVTSDTGTAIGPTDTASGGSGAAE
ncbi:MAG: hypothetical protein ABMB14_33620 [Myxococcota bacterium]